MKLQVAIFSLVVLILAEFGEAAIRYRSCGKATIKSVTFEGSDNAPTPNVFRGQTYTAKIEYVASSAHNDIESNWYGVLGGKDLKWDELKVQPGCKTVYPPCPIKPGTTYVYKESVMVPLVAPKMRSVVRLRQLNPAGGENICILFSLNIK